jgi:hypothetical protein
MATGSIPHLPARLQLLLLALLANSCYARPGALLQELGAASADSISIDADEATYMTLEGHMPYVLTPTSQAASRLVAAGEGANMGCHSEAAALTAAAGAVPAILDTACRLLPGLLCHTTKIVS